MSREIIRQDPDQRAVVMEMESLRCALGMSIGAMADGHLGYKHDVYRRLISNTYPISTPAAMARVIDACRAAIVSVRTMYAAQLAAMERPAAAKLPVRRAADFRETETVAAVTATFEEAVENAESVMAGKSNNPLRVVILVGPTGAGKTECIANVCRNFGGYYTTGTPLWKSSLTAGMADIVLAARPKATWSSRWQLQALMFEVLSQPVKNPVTGLDQPPVLFLDTFNLGGSHMWGLAFSIIDKTPAVVCIAGTNEMMDRACIRSFDIASQCMGRTLQTFEIPHLQTGDVAPLLEGCGLNGALGHATEKLTASANNFGRWRLVHRVIQSVKLENSAHLTAESFDRILDVELDKIRAAVVTERLRSMAGEKRRNSQETRLALHETTRAALAETTT